ELRFVVVVLGGKRREHSEHSVGLIVGAGCEEQRVARARRAAVAEREPPESVYLQLRSIRVTHAAEELAGDDVERRDRAVAEVADQYRVAEFAEIGWREGDTPRRVEIVAVLQARDKPPAGGEDIDETEAGTGHFVVLRVVLLRVRDVQIGSNALD